MAWEPRGHGGLNGRSIKASAGSLRRPEERPRQFKVQGGFQPAAEESVACASTTETLSKARLKTTLNDFISEPDWLTAPLPPPFPVGAFTRVMHCHPVTHCSCRHLLLQPQLPPHATCPASAWSGILPWEDQSHHQCTAGALLCKGGAGSSPSPVLKVNQKYLLQMNACTLQVLLSQRTVNATGLGCHRRRHMCTYTSSATPLPLPQITERFNKMHHLAGFTETCHLRFWTPFTGPTSYSRGLLQKQMPNFDFQCCYCLPITTPAIVWNLSTRHGSDHFHSFAKWHGKHITCRRKCHYHIYAFIIWQRF